MQKSLRYVIFRTKWGYFGLAGTGYALCRTCLPQSERDKVKSWLLKNLTQANQILNKGRVGFSPPSSAYKNGGAGPTLQMDIRQESSIEIEYDKNLFKSLQEQITAYFEGAYIDFSPDIPIVLDGFSTFRRSVLFACRKVKYGQLITYSALADKIGNPSSARAVGNALARNTLPLIIPCHRVVRNDGKLGGFSAPGGISLKKRLLELEKRIQ